MLSGILLIDKPTGPTSHDIVDQVRKWSSQRRVGHTGTLDPAASGLLVVMLGKASRLSRWMSRVDKDYEGLIRFGVGTDTLDAQGIEIDRQACSFTEAQLKAAAAEMIGETSQIPPKYSAVKTKGRPAYVLARKGEDPQLSSRPIVIEKFTIALVSGGDFPLYRFFLSCSSGTYVRSVAADLGAAVGSLAHVESLRRSRVGTFSIEESISVAELIKRPAPEDATQPLLPMGVGIELPEVAVMPDDVRQVVSGVAVDYVGRNDGRPRTGSEVKIVLAGDGGLLGLGIIEDDRVNPFKVLVDP